MNKVLTVLLIFLPVLVTAQNKAFSESDLSADGQKAFSVLMSARRFESTAVGIGGDPSKYVAAYREILKEQNRVDALKQLLAKASVAGQMYALAGLYDADHAYFLSVVEIYKNDKREIDIREGCIGFKQTVQELVFLDKPNTVRLDYPSQPFREWRQKAQIRDGEGFMMDISGGGWSWAFRGRDL